MNLILCAALIATASPLPTSQHETGSEKLQTYKPSVGYVKIFTPTTERYDDGMWRLEYEGYDVYTEDGNMLQRVGESLDVPRILRLNEGSYIIRIKRSGGPVESFRVVVEPGKTTVVER